MSESDDSMIDHIDWRQAGIFGGAAWLASLVVTYVLVTVTELADFGNESTLDIAIWTLAEANGIFYEDMSALLGYGAVLDTDFWTAVVLIQLLVPVIALVVTGYLLAKRYRTGEVDTVSSPTANQIAIGGVSLGVVYGALTLVAMVLFGGDPASYDFLRLLVIGFTYPLVFASVGVGLEAGITRAFNLEGLGAGAGAVVAGFVLWYLLDDDASDADPDGLAENMEFLIWYFQDTHAILEIGDFGYEFAYDAFIPDWYVFLAIIAIGAALVYRAEITDWKEGLRTGAHLGSGYFVLTTLIALFGSAIVIEDIIDTGADDWDILWDAINQFIAPIPPTIVLAVMWAVALGAVGGAVGAKIVESQQEEDGAAAAEPTATESEATTEAED